MAHRNIKRKSTRGKYTKADLKKAEEHYNACNRRWSQAENMSALASSKLEKYQRLFETAEKEASKARSDTYAAAEKLDKIRKSFGLKTLREEIGL